MNPFRPTLLAGLFTGAVLATGQTGPERSGAASWVENLEVSASVSTTWVDNISRTSHEPTRKDAELHEFAVGVSRHRQLAGSWLLNLDADAAYTSEPDFNLNSHLKLGPRLGLQHKFGLGPLAPVLLLDTALTYKSSRLSADTGWTAEAGLRWSKRLTPEFKVSASGRWLEHYANSATFDLTQRSLSLEAVWDLNEHWRLSGTAGRLRGHVVAHAAGAVWTQAITGGLGATVFNYYTTVPWEVTHAYGPNWVSYNVDATVDLWSVTLSRSLTEHTTLELRASGAYVVNKIDIRYPTDSWGLGLIHRF